MGYSPILGNPKPQYSDNNGPPYVGMRLFTYAAGTSTKLASQTDSGGLTDNTNPIVFGADGFPESDVGIYGDNITAYKVVAAPPGSDDPPTSPLWTLDNLYPNQLLDPWTGKLTATRTSTTTFTVAGDQTALFHEGVRLKTTGGADRYSTVASSAYTASTEVTVQDITDGSTIPVVSTLHASMDTVYLSILPNHLPILNGVEWIVTEEISIASASTIPSKIVIKAGGHLNVTAASTFSGPILIEPGGLFTHGAAVICSSTVTALGSDSFAGTSTINFTGSLNAGDYKLFTGSGAVTISGNSPKNPLWWGAVGDDSTDSTTAIQAALNQVKTDGDSIVIPPGVYKVTAALTTGPLDNKKTSIIGYGATLKQYTNSVNTINVRNSRCSIKGIKFESDTAVTASSGVGAISILDVNDVSVSECIFNNIKTVGILLETGTQLCTDISIKGNHFNKCSATAININGADAVNIVQRVAIGGNTFNASDSPIDSQTRAIHLVANVTDVSIVNNTTSGTGVIGYATGWRDCIMIGNNSATSQPDNIVVQGNIITGMGDDGVGISGATNISITGNVIHSSPVTAGIYVPGSNIWVNDNVVITGNTIYGHALGGIYLKDTTSYVISGNLIHDCDIGIYVNDVGGGSDILRGTISNNTLHTLTNFGIHWDGGDCAVTGNTIDGFGNAAGAESEKAGIFMSGAVSGSVISNNIIKNGIHGMLVTGAGTGFSITGNVVNSNNTGYGLYFLSFTGDNMIVSGNFLNATTGAYLSRPVPTPTIVYSGNIPNGYGTYTPTNVTPDRAFDADTVVIAELADIVGTLISDLSLD